MIDTLFVFFRKYSILIYGVGMRGYEDAGDAIYAFLKKSLAKNFLAWGIGIPKTSKAPKNSVSIPTPHVRKVFTEFPRKATTHLPIPSS